MNTAAIKKIKTEFNAENAKFSPKGKAVSTYVISILTNFCEQNSEFSQAVMQSDKTVVDCINATVENAANAISDLDVCKNAAAFYFPSADVHFIMQIDLGDGGISNTTQITSPAPQKVDISLDSLLDF